jgi:hypothetical protein
MDRFIDMIEKIFDLQKGPMKFIVVVFIASLILLFVPANILETLSLAEFKNEQKKYIGLACTISALFILISIVNFAWSKINDSINDKKVRRYILRNL